MWLLIVLIFFGIIFLSPIAVIILLIERSGLRRRVAELGEAGNLAREGRAFSEGYDRALEDVLATDALSDEPLTVQEALNRLKSVRPESDDAETAPQELLGAEQSHDDLVSTSSHMAETIGPEEELYDESEDIWGNTLDGLAQERQSTLQSEYSNSSVRSTSTPPPPPPVSSGISQQSVINIVLFTGALLIVSAAAAFVATSTSPVLKALSMWVAVALFYGAGVWLYSNKNLTQVGVAFLGIGLALVPFAGIVLSLTLEVQPVFSWLLASALSVVLSVHMLWLIRTEVAGYVSIFSLISLAIALSRNVSDDIFWIFVPIMLVGFALQLLRQFGPQPLASWLLRPVSVMSVASPLVTLVISLPYFTMVGYIKFEILLLIALVQFALYAAYLKSYAYELVVRVLATVLLGVVSAHVASLTDTSYVLLVGAGTTLAVLIQLSLALGLLKQREDEVYRTEVALMPWYVGALWGVATMWYLSVNVLPAATVAQVLVVTVTSYIVGSYLNKNSFRYSAIAGVWLLPYAIIQLPILSGLDVQSVLAWYYLAASTLLNAVYVVAVHRGARRGEDRKKRWPFIVSVLLHTVSSLLHASMVVESSLLFLSLILLAFMMGLFAVYERKERLYVVSHIVTLLAAWRLLSDVVANVEGWMAGIVAIAVGICGWLVAEVVSRRKTLNVVPDLYASTLAMLGMGLIASWMYAAVHDQRALLGVVALIGVAGLLYWRAHKQKKSALRDLAVYTLSAAVVYAIFIFDTAGDVIFPVYTLLVSAVAAGLWLAGGEWGRRSNNFVISVSLLLLGGFASMGWGLVHDMNGYWGVGSLFVLTLLLLVRYRTEGLTFWLESAIYACTAAMLYSFTIVDTESFLPTLLYVTTIGAVITGAAVISDSVSRRQSGYATALILFGFSTLVSWPDATSHAWGGFWGVLGLLAIALVLGLRYREAGQKKTVEMIYYTVASAICYGIFILDRAESISFVVYLHVYVLALVAAALLYRNEQREIRLKIAAGLVTGFVGLNALAGSSTYQVVFLIEHVIMLLLGAITSRRWAMIWAASAISVAVLYFLRGNSWLTLLLIGLLLVGFAIYRSTQDTTSKKK